MSQTKLAEQLQTVARIDLIRKAQLNLNIIKRREVIRDRLDEYKEIDLNKECYNF